MTLLSSRAEKRAAGDKMALRAVLLACGLALALSCDYSCLNPCLLQGTSTDCFQTCCLLPNSLAIGGVVVTETGQKFNVQEVPMSQKELVEEEFDCDLECAAVCSRFSQGQALLDCITYCGCGCFITEVPPPVPSPQSAPVTPPTTLIDSTPTVSAAPESASTLPVVPPAVLVAPSTAPQPTSDSTPAVLPPATPVEQAPVSAAPTVDAPVTPTTTTPGTVAMSTTLVSTTEVCWKRCEEICTDEQCAMDCKADFCSFSGSTGLKVVAGLICVVGLLTLAYIFITAKTSGRKYVPRPTESSYLSL